MAAALRPLHARGIRPMRLLFKIQMQSNCLHHFCLCLTIVMAVVMGCQSKFSNLPSYQPATQPLSDTGISEPKPIVAVDAIAAPPIGWKALPIQGDDRHSHQ